MDAVFLQHAREGRLDLASSGLGRTKGTIWLDRSRAVAHGQAFFDMPLAAPS
jgi:hypothetical protein